MAVYTMQGISGISGIITFVAVVTLADLSCKAMFVHAAWDPATDNGTHKSTSSSRSHSRRAAVMHVLECAHSR